MVDAGSIQRISFDAMLRTGEAVNILDPHLNTALRQYAGFALPGDPLLRRSCQHFRLACDVLLKAANIQGYIRPYSLRRGRTTHYFRTTASMDLAKERGRWNNVRTAKIYINVCLQDFLAMSPAEEKCRWGQLSNQLISRFTAA